VTMTQSAKKAETSQEALMELRRQMRVALNRLFKKIEFGVGTNKWEPILFVTLVDGTRAIVDVTPFLHPQSLQAHKKMIVEESSNK
jgi:hypothetical protein